MLPLVLVVALGASLLLAADDASPMIRSTNRPSAAPPAPASSTGSSPVAPRQDRIVLLIKEEAPGSGAEAGGRPLAEPFRPVVKPVHHRHVRYSWAPGCPVGPSQLRRLRVGYLGFDGAYHRGTLVVAASAVPAVRAGFRAAYKDGFAIRRIRPVDRYYGGSRSGMARSDARSMRDDNTSAFNCRYATGSSRLSRHAWGDAVDVNPRENPHVLGGRTYPANGAAYADRSPLRAGMLGSGSAMTRAFRERGWTWGGSYAAPDYQHVSRTGA